MFLQKRKKLESWRKSEEKAVKVIGSEWFGQITRRNWPNHSQRQRQKLDWTPGSDWGKMSKWFAQITRRICPNHFNSRKYSRGGKRAEIRNSKKRSPSPLQTPQDQSQEPRPSLREFHSQSNTKTKEESKTTKKTKSNWDSKTLIKLELGFSSYIRAASKPTSHHPIFSNTAKNYSSFLPFFSFLSFEILSTMSG